MLFENYLQRLLFSPFKILNFQIAQKHDSIVFYI